MTDETEVVQPEAAPEVVAEPVAEAAPVVAEEAVVVVPKVASPEGVHSALESLEAEFARFGDWFRQKIADARSHL